LPRRVGVEMAVLCLWSSSKKELKEAG